MAVKEFVRIHTRIIPHEEILDDHQSCCVSATKSEKPYRVLAQKKHDTKKSRNVSHDILIGRTGG